MKNLVILLGITTIIAGCTTIETTREKFQIYDEVTAEFLKPDKVVACYSRDEEKKKGFEARCFGEACKVPTCPQ